MPIDGAHCREVAAMAAVVDQASPGRPGAGRWCCAELAKPPVAALMISMRWCGRLPPVPLWVASWRAPHALLRWVSLVRLAHMSGRRYRPTSGVGTGHFVLHALRLWRGAGNSHAGRALRCPCCCWWPVRQSPCHTT